MFDKNEIVIHRYYDEQKSQIKFVKATIMDPGTTLTSILIFELEYENGNPCMITVDNNTLINLNKHKSNIRDEKINIIIDEKQENQENS